MANINPSLLGGSQNAYGIVDSRYPVRWYDAWGDVVKFIPDVPTPTTDITTGVNSLFTTTIVETGAGETTIQPATTQGDLLLITTDAAEYDGINAQAVGTAFALTSGKPLYFGAKVTISDATQSDFLIGLAGVDTTLLNSSISHAIAVGASFVGFTKLDATTQGYFKTITTATENNSSAAFTMDTSAHVYEFYWDGATLYAYFDGVLKGSYTSNIPTAVMTPSFNFRAGEAVAKTMTISWMRCIQVLS